MVRLKFEPFDGRSSNYLPIIDEETGMKVGTIQSSRTGPDRDGRIYISLFGGKYQTLVNGYDAAQGFLLGVQCVLNHMTSPDYPTV
jgi:hypothetical protein